jgi:hypothetical protein
LREREEKRFYPKNTILNPGEHSIGNIITGFSQYNEKGIWYIMFNNGLLKIYFNQKFADRFNNEINQSFAAL